MDHRHTISESRGGGRFSVEAGPHGGLIYLRISL